MATIFSIIESIAVIIAAVVAMVGINAWRREHVGRKRIDTAEEILELFYEAKDALTHIRSPFSHSGEGRSRARRDGETEGEAKLLDQAYVAFERYQSYKEKFARLKALRYRAVTYWGNAAAAPFQTLEEITHKIFVAANMLPSYWKRQGVGPYPGGFEAHLREMRALEADFWSGGEDDKLTPLTATMVQQAEQLCRPVIADTGDVLATVTQKKNVVVAVVVTVVVVVGLALLALAVGAYYGFEFQVRTPSSSPSPDTQG